MGNRLTRIYTRTGDSGTTGLADGSRVDKSSQHIAAIGTIDELNSQLGVVLAEPIPEPVAAVLTAVQHTLFDMGGELARNAGPLLGRDTVDALEREIDHFNAGLPPLREFVLPGGDRAAAACHVARSVCRRAERCLVRLGQSGQVNSHSLAYLNRLSDLLFVCARVLARAAGCGEVLWNPQR